MIKRIIWVILVVVCLTLICFVIAQAETNGTVGNLSWVLNDDGILTISGTGPMINEYTEESRWYSDSNLVEVIIEDGVTSVGNYAFEACPNLSSVVLPDTVTTIGEGAFSQCTKLTDITLPAGLTQIGNYAFYRCAELTEITLPDNLR